MAIVSPLKFILTELSFFEDELFFEKELPFTTIFFLRKERLVVVLKTKNLRLYLRFLIVLSKIKIIFQQQI
jgi:hypothetical protein